jgi:hypothetical protein
VVEVQESIDEEEEREEAEAIAETTQNSKSRIETEIEDIEEHEDGGGYRHQRFQAGVATRASKANSVSEYSESEEDDYSESEEDEDSEESEEEKSSVESPAIKHQEKVILDPVLSKGGFKILPQYHDTSIFEKEDLVDRIENGLYKDYIHKGSKVFKDIFDVAVLSRADADIIFFPGLDKKRKKKLNIDSRIAELKKEDINFEFNKKEQFEVGESTSFESDGRKRKVKTARYD